MESNIWQDSETSGRPLEWSLDGGPLFSFLLQDTGLFEISQRDYKKPFTWLQTITGLLQRTQRATYATRRAELLSLEAKNFHKTVIALLRGRATRRNQMLMRPGESRMLLTPYSTGGG